MATSQHRDIRNLPSQDGYQQLHSQFRWLVPEEFNIAEVCSRRWAQAADAGQRIAVHADGPGLQAREHTYAESAAPGQPALKRLGSAARGQGRPGGHRAAAALRNRRGLYGRAAAGCGGHAPVHAVRARGAGIPPERQRAAVAICDDASIVTLQNIRGNCEALRHVIGVGDSASGDSGGGAAGMADLDYAALLAEHPPEYDPVLTRADDPAAADLHQRHHRQPQGRADSAPRPARQPDGLCLQPELVRLRSVPAQKSPPPRGGGPGGGEH